MQVTFCDGTKSGVLSCFLSIFPPNWNVQPHRFLDFSTLKVVLLPEDRTLWKLLHFSPSLIYDLTKKEKVVCM
jgi:hypothetical protein